MKLAVKACLAFWGIVALPLFAETHLTGRLSAEQAIFVKDEAACVRLEATGLKPGERRALSIVLKDERGRMVGTCANDGIVAAGDGSWRGEFPVPTDRYGFRRVCVTSGDLTLPKCGSRPKGCLTYAVVPDPAKRPKIPEEDAFFGLQGRSFCRWTGAHHLFSASTPSPNVTSCLARTQRQLSGDVPVYGTIAAEYRFVKPFMAKEAAACFVQRAKVAPRLPFSFAAGDVAGERHFRETTKAFARAARDSRPGRRIYEYAQECDLAAPDAETVVRCQKAFYEAVHEADPEAIVTAAGVSNVLKPKQNFMRRLFELGIADSMDAFSIHPYTPYPPEPNGFLENIRAFTDIVRQHKGPDAMMVATEGGFAAPASGEVEQMEGNIRVALMLLGEGYAFHLMFWTIDFGNDNYDWFDGDYGLNYNLELKTNRYSNMTSPRPVLPALAAATLLLDGKRPVTPIETLGPTAFGYAYADRDDRCALALWDFGGEDHEVSVPVGRETVDVADIMGNVTRCSAQGGNVTLKLTGAPVYVLDPASNLWGHKGLMRRKLADELAERKKREEAACRVKILSAAPAFFGRRPGVRVELENRTSTSRTCRVGVRIRGVPEARQSAEVVLAARGTGEVALPFDAGVRLDPSLRSDVEVSVSCADGFHAEGKQSFNFLGAQRVPESVGEGGDFWAWRPTGRFDWPADTGASDGERVRMGLGWNSRYLLVDVAVLDDLFSNRRTGATTWAGDSIQLGLAKAELRQSSGNYQTDLQDEAMSEITLALTTNGPSAYRTVTFDPVRFPTDNKGGGEISRDDLPLEIIVRTNATRAVARYRAAIPWRFLNVTEPVAGQVIRLGAFSNDSDANPAMSALKCRVWFGLKDVKRFAHVVLCGEESSTPNASDEAIREIGQSQPAKEAPIPWTTCDWCVNDADGNTYLPDGWRIRRGCIRPEKCVDNVPGRKFTDGHGHIWSWDIRTGELVSVRATGSGLERGKLVLRTKPWRNGLFFVAPSGVGGWTDRAAFGWLDRTSGCVEGYAKDGTELGVLLDCAAAGLTNVLSAAFHPENGDLLVSENWPNRKVHRFSVGGNEVATGLWPHVMAFPATADGFGLVNGELYLCGRTVERVTDAQSARYRFDCPSGGVSALADGGDGWWLATWDGALHVPKSDPSRCDARIGGVAKPTRLCVSGGQVKAEIGWRVFSFWLDGLLDEKPASIARSDKNAWPPAASASADGWSAEYDEFRHAIRVRKEFAK